ncbi:hypothetical protein NQ318_000289 [Aromia moschata]|uniref:Uncharacterized protein n=1 Tax=Aromia moschata TaxID=1265417 RepID=A0AAV8YTC7_9CUCU|nr:hypothetical protein NQ318_000289 [Aromia moschata]
MEKPSRKRHR